MFSFIGRWFGKGKKDDEEEEEVKPWEKGDPIPYSLDFEDAEEILISARDCTRANVEAVEQLIRRPAEVAAVVKLLASFPEQGTQRLKTNQCLEHTVTAYKEEVPFAQITFYDGHLLFPNHRFIGSGANEKLHKKQAELYELIRIDIE